jgi:regulation of enolase protein 1 (concanavalin A-like superfamily)
MNPPKQWRQDGTSLVCTADAKTDFWRKTFYGYITDNGHFYYRRIAGDFTTTVRVAGEYHDLYDQAGLMVRIDGENWMKCGVEFVDRHQNMSIVYTREYSSWATGRLPAGTAALWLKVVRKGPALDIFHSLDGQTFVESGVGYLGAAESVMVGPMCAAPEGKGFEVRFDEWKVLVA